jgi:aminomethyltransferase
MYVFNVGESLLFDTDRTQVEGLLTAMKRFIIMDKVELTPVEEIKALGVCGPRVEQLLSSIGLEAAGLALLEMRSQQWDGCEVRILRGPENKPGWYELWSNEACIARLNERIQSAGARPVGAQALEWWRILRGIPHYGQDIRDRDLPQETAQMQALNFTKGCYIGQEIVERIRSRGQVHRKFTGFEFAGAPPSPGKFEAGGRAFAELTSVARIPGRDRERVLGLGYVREETRATGPTVDLNGCKAVLADLPFAI